MTQKPRCLTKNATNNIWLVLVVLESKERELENLKSLLQSPEKKKLGASIVIYKRLFLKEDY